MKIELWPIDRPVEYARNARRISDAAVDKVAASIKEFGWRQPIVVDTDGVIVVGHTRRRAAQKLGLAEVPVHIATDLTPAQVKAYRLMDNRSGEEAKWDYELLGLELQDMQQLADIDLSLTGFEQFELDPLLQCDWSPPDPETENGPSTLHNTEGKRNKLVLTDEQRSMLDLAVAKLREREGNPKLDDGQTLFIVCSEFVAE